MPSGAATRYRLCCTEPLAATSTSRGEADCYGYCNDPGGQVASVHARRSVQGRVARGCGWIVAEAGAGGGRRNRQPRAQARRGPCGRVTASDDLGRPRVISPPLWWLGVLVVCTAGERQDGRLAPRLLCGDQVDLKQLTAAWEAFARPRRSAAAASAWPRQPPSPACRTECDPEGTGVPSARISSLLPHGRRRITRMGYPLRSRRPYMLGGPGRLPPTKLL